MFQRIRYFLRELNWLAVIAVVLGAAGVISPFITHNLVATTAFGFAGIICAILAKDA